MSSSSGGGVGGSHNHAVRQQGHGGGRVGPVLKRMASYVGGKVKTSFAVFGLVAACGLYAEYRRVFPKDDDDEGDGKKKKKKQVLLIPFNRIDLKDKHDDRDFLSRWDGAGGFGGAGDDTPVLRLDVRELVDLIHKASSDPNIVALYGVFGHGSLLSKTAGWADLEEVRNALKVFRESHRVHNEPNVNHDNTITTAAAARLRKSGGTNSSSKPLYAYADSFASIGDPGNKEYYLASIFTHIHMQEKGELNLFGLLSQQFFLKGLLEKYGILVHVFKHGQYKNAANIFTDDKLTYPHRENVTNILMGLNTDICEDITTSRSKALLASWLKNTANSSSGKSGTVTDYYSKFQEQQQEVWKRIHESGTFPALTAFGGGLVDYLPRRDPLTDLVQNSINNNDDCTKDSADNNNNVKKNWNVQETDFDKFKADKILTLSDYAKKIKKKKAAEERRRKYGDLINKHPRLVKALSSLGIKLPSSSSDVSDVSSDGTKTKLRKKEKIALLYVQGAIDDKQARKMVNTLRKIRKENNNKDNKNNATNKKQEPTAYKCVVVRVTSPGGTINACETISEELKSLGIPVVFSFGNVAASGGYYIASMSDRIFASNKTVTGSIGVFGLRADITGLAEQYGITTDHVPAGDLSATYDPLCPMSRKMKNNIASSIDRYYLDFKNVVSSGRSLPLDDVEHIGQGRVWTGTQAKKNGLVDEIGGLYRAIAYAKRNYCDDGEGADIVVWPKKRGLLELLSEAAKDGGDVTPLLRTFVAEAISSTLFSNKGPVSSAAVHDLDTNAAMIHDLLASHPTTSSSLSSQLSGFYYTADENAAIQCLVDGIAARSSGEENNSKSRDVLSDMIPPPTSFWE